MIAVCRDCLVVVIFCFLLFASALLRMNQTKTKSNSNNNNEQKHSNGLCGCCKCNRLCKSTIFFIFFFVSELNGTKRMCVWDTSKMHTILLLLYSFNALEPKRLIMEPFVQCTMYSVVYTHPYMMVLAL